MLGGEVDRRQRVHRGLGRARRSRRLLHHRVGLRTRAEKVVVEEELVQSCWVHLLHLILVARHRSRRRRSRRRHSHHWWDGMRVELDESLRAQHASRPLIIGCTPDFDSCEQKHTSPQESHRTSEALTSREVK